MRYLLLSLLLAFTCVSLADEVGEPSLRLIDRTHPAFDFVAVPRAVPPPPPPFFDVRTYGARGDGSTFDTAAIQRAVDTCAGSGGSVLLSGGKFLTAPLVLKGGMTFYIAQGAVLLGSTRPHDYPDRMPPQTVAQALRKSLLFASAADHLVLDGGGEIDGQGQQLPMNGKEPDRPSLLRVFGSKGVTVRNLTLRNPRMWTQVYSECSDLTIDHEQVFSPPGYCPNLDGMDICDSDHVTISNCQVEAQDDAICLKSHGPRGLHDITITNNRIRDFDANGIKIGTATNGPIQHILIEKNVISQASFGGLCVESVDGAQVSDITVRDLDMEQVSQPIYIRLSHRIPPRGDLQFVSMTQHPVGSIDHVLIENIRAIHPGSKTTPSITITGIPQALLGHITMRNAYIEMPGGLSTVPPTPGEHDGEYPQSSQFGDVPAYAFYIRHAGDVTLSHVTAAYLARDVRPWLAKNEASVTTISCSDLGQIRP